MKLLAKILADEIRTARKMNVTKYRSFKEMLEETLQKYHNRAIQAADVVRVMLEIRKDIDNEATRSKLLVLRLKKSRFTMLSPRMSSICSTRKRSATWSAMSLKV